MWQLLIKYLLNTCWMNKWKWWEPSYPLGLLVKKLRYCWRENLLPFHWQWEGQARQWEPNVKNAAEVAKKKIWWSRPLQGELSSPDNTTEWQANSKKQMNESFLSQHLPWESRRPENSRADDSTGNVISSHCGLLLVPLAVTQPLSSYLLLGFHSAPSTLAWLGRNEGKFIF